jgi:hypothetical protein
LTPPASSNRPVMLCASAGEGGQPKASRASKPNAVAARGTSNGLLLSSVGSLPRGLEGKAARARGTGREGFAWKASTGRSQCERTTPGGSDSGSTFVPRAFLAFHDALRGARTVPNRNTLKNKRLRLGDPPRKSKSCRLWHTCAVPEWHAVPIRDGKASTGDR